MSGPGARLGRTLAATLERQIQGGRWQSGSRLPAERDLAAQYEMSRQTVREALGQLHRAGLVTRRRGSGTYVAERRLEQSLLGHFSVVESLRSAGSSIATQLRSQATVRALPATARGLAVRAGARVLELERLRSVDGRPLMLERTWLPVARLPGIERVDISRGLYAALRGTYDIVLVRAVESFEPVTLRPEEAAALDGETGRPALMLLRTTYDEDDRPIEMARAILRADRCRTLVERRTHEPDRRPRPGP